MSRVDPQILSFCEEWSSCVRCVPSVTANRSHEAGIQYDGDRKAARATEIRLAMTQSKRTQEEKNLRKRQPRR